MVTKSIMLDDMDEIKTQLTTRGFSGDIEDAADVLEKYSHDASMFEIKPQLVIAPKSAADVTTAVRLVADKKKSSRSFH